MLVMALAAAALAAGAPVPLVAAVVIASFLPPVAIVAVVAVIAAASIARHRIGRSESTTSEGSLLRLLAGRVSGGASIRSTIADPTITAIPEPARRMATLGMPLTDVGGAMADVLPVNGQSLRAICSFSEHTGAAISSALGVLAERADEATELARQKRVSLAQARFSAVVVGIVPVALSAGLIILNGVPSPGGAVIVLPMAVGFGLQVLGTLIVFRVSSKAG